MPPGVKVSVSSDGDHPNFPTTDGEVLKADCTELVSMGLLNCRTMLAEVETFVAGLGEVAIGERIPLAEESVTGVELTGAFIVAQAKVGVEGMGLNELGIF